MITPDNHTLKPDGIHCKNSDGGSDGMTYQKHFAKEVESRMKNGRISLEDLIAAGDATKAKYPKQMASATPATAEFKNQRPLGKSTRKSSKGVKRGIAVLPVVPGVGNLTAKALRGSGADLGRSEGPCLAVGVVQGALSEHTTLLDHSNEEMAFFNDYLYETHVRLAGQNRPEKYGWFEYMVDLMIISGAASNGL